MWSAIRDANHTDTARNTRYLGIKRERVGAPGERLEEQPGWTERTWKQQRRYRKNYISPKLHVIVKGRNVVPTRRWAQAREPRVSPDWTECSNPEQLPHLLLPSWQKLAQDRDNSAFSEGLQRKQNLVLIFQHLPIWQLPKEGTTWLLAMSYTDKITDALMASSIFPTWFFSLLFHH